MQGAKIGNTIIPYSEASNVSSRTFTSPNRWINLWQGAAIGSPVKKGISLDKDCKKCVFDYALLLSAHDTSDFNPGQSFGDLGILTEDDTWIWVRDHTWFGHDYEIYSFRNEGDELTYYYEQ
jgi:hypothetical protein